MKRQKVYTLEPKCLASSNFAQNPPDMVSYNQYKQQFFQNSQYNNDRTKKSKKYSKKQIQKTQAG